MKSFIVVYILLISALITSPLTICHGLVGKPNNKSDPVITTCRQTTDFGFCVFTLRSDPRSAKSDQDGLAHIALEKLGTHARDTWKYLQGLQRNATDAKAKALVGLCFRLYGLATSKDIPGAFRSLKGKAFRDAIRGASAAMKEGGGCQDGISKNPSPKWQILSYRNEYMHDLSQLVIDIVGLLGKSLFRNGGI